MAEKLDIPVELNKEATVENIKEFMEIQERFKR